MTDKDFDLFPSPCYIMEEEPHIDKECCRPGWCRDYPCFQVLCHVALVSHIP